MELSLQQKRALLAPVRCFLLDMDGTFYLGNQLLEGSLDFYPPWTQRDGPRVS